MFSSSLRRLTTTATRRVAGGPLAVPQRLAANTTCMTANRYLSDAAAKEAKTPKPSAFDVVVQLTFVDPNGARRQVPGLVGKFLTRHLHSPS